MKLTHGKTIVFQGGNDQDIYLHIPDNFADSASFVGVTSALLAAEEILSAAFNIRNNITLKKEEMDNLIIITAHIDALAFALAKNA